MGRFEPPIMFATYEKCVEPEFDSRTGNYHIDYDADSAWPVSTAIVLALSSLTDLESTSMCPLNDVVDADALNEHVRGRERDAEMSFESHGYRVSVRSDGRIRFASTRRLEV